MPIFCFNFNSISIHFPLLQFLFLFFNTINFSYLIFELCWQLLCWHSCQYFVWFFISFLIHFQLLHFLFLFFLFNNSISFYFCAVSTTAMLTLVPIFSGVVVCTQVLYSDCDSVHSLYREWSQWRPLQMAVNGWTKKVWQTHSPTH